MKKVIALLLTLAIFITAMPIGFMTSAVEINVGNADGKSYVLGDVIYSTDFEDEDVDSLPKGWEASGKSWGWGTGTGSAKVTQLGSYGKVLTITSSSLDYWVSMPEIKTRNYVYEASLCTTSGSTSGAIGIANGMYGGINSAGGAVYASIYLQKFDGCYYRSKGTPSVQKVEFTRPSKNIMTNAYKLKFVCLDGVNYLYIDDTFMGALSQGQSDSISDWAGFFVCGGSHNVTSVTVTEIITPEIDFNNVSIDTAEDEVALNLDLSFDKGNEVYEKAISGKYFYSDNATIKFGMVYAVSDSVALNNITVDTFGAEKVVFTQNSESYEKLYFSKKIKNIKSENLDKFYEIRPFVLINSQYIYGESRSYSPASLANNIYNNSNKETKEKLSTLFKDSTVFKGENKKTLTFTLFSDFHYEQDKYIGSIEDLRTILNRADTSGSAFVMSAGDFCNNFKGSPELTNTYLNYKKADGTTLTAYNIYGNHELESTGNSMENVTPTLTNNKNVVWGTADGSFDSNIAYYYFEENGFRIVCLDTNYSKNAKDEWEHNYAASYGPPSGNTASNSLGDVQLAWLESVLTDAANNSIPCIVVSHDGFSGKFATSSSDAVTVRALYAKINAIKAGTVIMSINGHHHTNNQGYEDGVFYFDTNTVFNGRWLEMGGSHNHYTATQTYRYENYDDEGNLISVSEKPLRDLWQAHNTWFFEDPLSAVITVDEYGAITVDGMETTWLHDVVPENLPSGKMPSITTGTFWDCSSLGHVWTDEWAYNTTHHWHTCTNDTCIATDVSLNYGYETHTFEEIESDEFLVAGKENVYYKSCFCGAVSEETFGDIDSDDTPEEIIEVWDGSVASSYAGGSGTSDDPYLIENASQLAYLVSKDTNTLGKYYALSNDIYLNLVVDSKWETTNQWFAKGKIAAQFQGTFDGKGYTISGLYHNANTNHVSLFPTAKNSTIKNVNLVNASITATNYSVAALVADPSGVTTFIGCSVDSSVFISGNDVAGYITRTTGGATFENCFSAPTMNGTKYAGAYIGDVWKNTAEPKQEFKNCIAVGSPFQGKNWGLLKVENCYGTESELAGVSGNLSIISSESMKGSAAIQNMPNLDWTNTWMVDPYGSYPIIKRDIVCSKHIFGEAATEFEATVYDKGVNAKSCLVCGHTEMEETAKLPTEITKVKLIGATKVVLDENSNIQYSINGKDWYNGNVITGLEKGMEYTVYVKRTNPVTGKLSGASEAIGVTTIDKDSITGEINAVELSNIRKQLLNNGNALWADVNSDNVIDVKDIVRAKKLASDLK